jgi:hypothetical protein
VCGFFLLLFNLATAVFNAHAENQNNLPTNAVKSPSELSLGRTLAELEKTGQTQSAVVLLESSLKKGLLPPHIIYWRLAKLARRANNSSKWRYYINNIASSDLVNNTQLMRELWHESPLADQKWLKKKLENWGFFEPCPSSPCAYFELDKRKVRAELLFDMLNKNAPEEKILYEIYIILPEIIDENKYNKSSYFARWQKKLKPEDFVTRINNLMLFGKNLEARRSYDDAQRISSQMSKEQSCELNYAFAKLQRKFRLYKDARSSFKSLEKCPEEIWQKARYMDLQLASMSGDLGQSEHFDSFVMDYPTHGLSDDVLLFKANLFLAKGDSVAGLEILSKLIELFPHGDMLERALFLKAFTLARQGQLEKALINLKALKEKSAPDRLAYAQAQYWTARLMLFPDINKLEKARKENMRSAAAILNNLVSSNNLNIYSWLSYELLGLLGKGRALPNKPQEKFNQAKIDTQDKHLKFINLLIEHDFKNEALALLEQEVWAHDAPQDLGVLAQSYINLGRPELGFQKLIKCDENRAAKLLNNWPQLYNQIAWPLPFLTQVQDAALHVDIPVYVINAMMRQESGFLQEARSWAQAHGLMQLVIATAKEQAAWLGLKEPTPRDLYQPQLNLLLGSSALFRYWQRFGHLAVALCAYNAGPAMAKKWLKESAGPLDTYIENINFKETRTYVINVLGGAFAYAVKNNSGSLPELAPIIF